MTQCEPSEAVQSLAVGGAVFLTIGVIMFLAVVWVEATNSYRRYRTRRSNR